MTGEMEKIRENGATSGIGVLATYAYDDLGRRTGLVRGNGATTGYAYDAVSRLSQLSHDMVGTGHDLTLGFTYNPASQIAQNTRSNDVYAWTGHGSGTTNSTANGLNQLATHGGGTPTHDARGNMTADGLGKTFGYSSENLLTSASGGVTLGYDPALRLYQVAGTATRRFGYDGTDTIAEYDAAGTLTQRYVFGPDQDEPLVWYVQAVTANPIFYHADERGTPVAGSWGYGGIAGVNTHDEYGKPGAINQGLFQYTGQKWIAEVGLYDYKARMYHPILPRFLQTDPVGYGDGMNMYAYVRADPINFVDPSGMCFKQWFAVFNHKPNDSGGYDKRRVPGSEFEVRIGCDQSSTNPVDTSGARLFLAGGGTAAGGAASAKQTLPPNPCNAPLPDGSTVNRNVDYIRSVLRTLESSRQAGDPRRLGTLYALGIWVGLVQAGGRWDYKLQPGGKQWHGNVNFGATGSLLLPLNIIRRGAGAVQDPATRGSGHWTDRGPSDYGDQPSDIPAIIYGATHCRGTE